MKNVIALVLAAGKGTRMKSDTPKVLHEILGKPIIHYVTEALNKAGIKDIIVIAGYGKEAVAKAVKPARVVIQKKLVGSGDAVLSAKKVLSKYSGDVLIICGDTPLVTAKTLKEIVTSHKRSQASCTVMTAELDDTASYGKIVRNAAGRVSKITEKTEAGEAEEGIREVNVGTYLFKSKDLFSALSEVRPNNKKGELYLTDTIEILNKRGKKVEGFIMRDPSEMTGINSRLDLACATKTLKEKVLKALMAEGVTIEDPSSTMIAGSVKIGRDSIIYSNTVIESDVVIGAGCRIGPFARIRHGVRLDNNVEVGNFVELVRTRVGRNTKIKHHTYFGDAVIGKDVNVGAGTITANFDGVNKHKTIIDDGAFLGIGTRLIAPVRIGKRAKVGAGAVVLKNDNVPNGATVVGVPAKILKK